MTIIGILIFILVVILIEGILYWALQWGRKGFLVFLPLEAVYLIMGIVALLLLLAYLANPNILMFIYSGR